MRLCPDGGGAWDLKDLALRWARDEGGFTLLAHECEEIIFLLRK